MYEALIVTINELDTEEAKQKVNDQRARMSQEARDAAKMEKQRQSRYYKQDGTINWNVDQYTPPQPRSHVDSKQRQQRRYRLPPVPQHHEVNEEEVNQLIEQSNQIPPPDDGDLQF